MLKHFARLIGLVVLSCGSPTAPAQADDGIPSERLAYAAKIGDTAAILRALSFAMCP